MQTDMELSLLREAANFTTLSKAQHELRQKNMVRQICSLFSRGSTSLQFGLFTTERELNRLAEKNLSKRF